METKKQLREARDKQVEVVKSLVEENSRLNARNQELEAKLNGILEKKAAMVECQNSDTFNRLKENAKKEITTLAIASVFDTCNLPPVTLSEKPAEIVGFYDWLFLIKRNSFTENLPLSIIKIVDILGFDDFLSMFGDSFKVVYDEMVAKEKEKLNSIIKGNSSRKDNK